MESNSQEIIKQKAKINFFSLDLVRTATWGVGWYILIFKGFSVFFAGFGIAPLDTIAQMIGVLIVPIVPTYFVARYLAVSKGKSFLSAWRVGTVIILVIMTVGMLNGQNHWW